MSLPNHDTSNCLTCAAEKGLTREECYKLMGIEDLPKVSLSLGMTQTIPNTFPVYRPDPLCKHCGGYGVDPDYPGEQYNGMTDPGSLEPCQCHWRKIT